MHNHWSLTFRRRVRTQIWKRLRLEPWALQKRRQSLWLGWPESPGGALVGMAGYSCPFRQIATLRKLTYFQDLAKFFNLNVPLVKGTLHFALDHLTNSLFNSPPQSAWGQFLQMGLNWNTGMAWLEWGESRTRKLNRHFNSKLVNSLRTLVHYQFTKWLAWWNGYIVG